MKDQDLVKVLREHAEWAEGNQYETPITLCDDLAKAAFCRLRGTQGHSFAASASENPARTADRPAQQKEVSYGGSG